MKISEALLYPSFAFGAVTAFNCTPSAFQSILPSNASVTFAYALPANSTFVVPSGDIAYPTSPTELDALCAVEVKMQSSNSSAFSFGLFLPTQWNKRYLYVNSVRLVLIY